jgi:hypothetical protein
VQQRRGGAAIAPRVPQTHRRQGWVISDEQPWVISGERRRWRLQAWLGHKRIDETMLYVHVAEAHHRELPEIVREKARAIDDPDGRVLAMLGTRASLELIEVRGSGAAVDQGPEMKKAAKTAA